MKQSDIDRSLVPITKSQNNIRIRRGKQKVVKIPYQMAKHTIDRIIYPVQTKRGLKFPKKKPLAIT